MGNMEIKFGVIELMGPLCSMDHNDRLYLATCGDHEFEFVAQYWRSETGKLTRVRSSGTRGWTLLRGSLKNPCDTTQWFTASPALALLRGGLKNPCDTAQWFTASPAWDAFEAATGVTPRAFRIAFEEFIIEDEAAREAAIIADED